MALTLLGTGTAISNVKNLQGNNSIIANSGTIHYYDGYDDTVNLLSSVYSYKGNSYVYTKSDIYSYVAPNRKAKIKSRYPKGIEIRVLPNIVHHDRYVDWMMTTSGYYIPARWRKRLELADMTKGFDHRAQLG